MRSTSHARVGARLPLALAVVWLLLAAHLVAAPGAAASGSVERVEDGGFELGSGAWTFEDGAERCSVASNNCGLPSAAGAFYAATAEFVNAPPGQVVPLRTGIITQLVSVPETSAALSFRVRRTGPGGTYSQLVVRYDGVELVKARPTTPFPLVTVPIPAGLIGPDPRPLTFEAVCVNHSAAHGVCDRFDLDTVSLTSPTAPSNAFTLGKPTLNKRKGLAKLPAKVPG
ncbi:hypothetical protein, partial [Nocardioides sp.]|uniref:hypothetical protein n=1 Tax=Nocardioides sp. TaxID=35761 RepID=UPI00273448AB